MAPTAVLHDAHTVGYDIATWMLHDLGYKVYAAGESFGRVLPEYRSNRYPPGNAFLTRKNGLPPWDGVVEIEDAPRDALFVDAFPSSEKALRDFGWEGPILYYWILPVGRNFIHEGRFRPGRKVGVVAFNRAVARLIRERNLCPVEFLLPPYDRAANFTVREDFEPYVVAAVNKVVDWAPLRTREMLKRLRDHPEANLQLCGLPPPEWAGPLEHPELVARVRKAKALYHVKNIDTPGYAWMEAAFQGVPVIFRPVFKDSTEFSFLEHDINCLIAERERDVIRCLRILSDPAENQRIGLALRNHLSEMTCWLKNRSRFAALLDSINGSQPARMHSYGMAWRVRRGLRMRLK
jgi:hypothetical protein